MKHLADNEIAARIAKGSLDNDLIAEVYRRFFPRMLYGAAVVLGFDNVLAEDVAQETLSRLLLDGSLRHLRDPNRIRAFLGAAARNAALDVNRALTARRESPPTENTSLDEWLDGEALLASRDQALARLARVLSTLKPEERDILSARFFEELTLDEIAARLGCSYAAAAQRLSRALSRARKKSRLFG